MTADGRDDRPDQDDGRERVGIDRLPENATEPGGSPPPADKPGEEKRGEDQPPAGPHADPDLVNPDSTPGAGTLTPPGEHDDIDSTSG
jgi:hypothetical protein